MYATFPGLRPLELPGFFTRWMGGLFIALSLMLAGLAAHAAPPPAGQKIINAASASYSDASGATYTVISNSVETTVQQVASLTLVANGAQNANPGGVVNYPHTLTNTGNGSDTFSLTTSNTGGFSMANVQIFADNGSGAPTGSPITSTGVLAAGASFKFIVQATLPGTATAAQTNTITATGTSVFDGTNTQSNTDVTTVTNNAIVTLTKSASVSSGPAGTAITYTLTYRNTGNVTATAVAITDVLPAGLTYTAGFARWSNTGSTVLSDSGASTGITPDTLTSSYTSGTRTLLVTLNQVPAGQSGTISFGVTVAAGAAPGATPNTANTATMSYNDGASTVTGSSNTVQFTVSQAASVTLTGATVASAAAGSTVSFTNVVTNTGNGTDTFNITLSTGNFPAGTTFLLFKSDGVTPLTDTNGDGKLDTGPVAAGANYNVIVKAALPSGATSVGAPFVVVKTATSVYDPTKSATADDRLTAVSSASVDATNNSSTGAGVPGVGVFASGEAAAQVTNTLDPGTSTTFTIVANNTGAAPDNYDLAVSTTSSFPGTLPAGWTVSFKASVAGSCTSTGAVITNTGSVAAGGNAVVCAVVAVPAGFAAGTVNLYFRTLSPNSGASDVLHDAVTVNALRSITLTPNGSGQVSANGPPIVYKHMLTNAGNVAEGNGTLSTVTLAVSNSQTAGWTSTLFLDSNNDGVLDGADQPITGNLASVLPAGLAPGAAITIFDKVTVTGGAPGAANVTTITATTSQGTYATTAPGVSVATDNTTVIAGNLTLVKMQAPDANCDGTPDGSYVQAALNAKPKECVLYQVTVTNQGTVNASSVVVSDSVPSYTTLSSLAATTVGTMTSPPALGATAGAAINAAVGTLTPSQSAVVTFGVRITP